jgi:hypothetical protein
MQEKSKKKEPQYINVNYIKKGTGSLSACFQGGGEVLVQVISFLEINEDAEHIKLLHEKKKLSL